MKNIHRMFMGQNNPIKRIDPDGNDWGGIAKGAAVALIDNATGGAVNLR